MRYALFLVGSLAAAGLAFACSSPNRTFADDASSAGGGTSDGPSSSHSGTGPTTTSSTGAGGHGNTTCQHDGDCDNGVCSDGFCCDRDCSAQCEACNVTGHEGTCTHVTGTPVAPRATCAGTGTCAGTCDGAHDGCSFPSNQTICGASCDGTCDGAGTCSTSGGACPNGFACGTSGCLTSCSQPSDCQPFFDCVNSACVRQPESDCLDGMDNNGDGLVDCEDPTCQALVECVPVARGGEVGQHITSGSCDPDYDTPEAFHTGLDGQPCTGCTCATKCTATYSFWLNNTCSGAPDAKSGAFTDVPGNPYTCQNITPAANYASGLLTDPAIAGCTAGGTATQAAPTWNTNDTFCAAKTSNSCGDSNHVCVAKPTTPICARVDASASCPAGYTNDEGLFYTDFTPGSCGACSSCTPAHSMTCTVSLLTDQVLTGANCAGGGTLIGTGTDCTGISRTPSASCELGFARMGVDDCSVNVTTNPPQPTGGARICCQ